MVYPPEENEKLTDELKEKRKYFTPLLRAATEWFGEGAATGGVGEGEATEGSRGWGSDILVDVFRRRRKFDKQQEQVLISVIAPYYNLFSSW